jgi:hypothetical protein
MLPNDILELRGRCSPVIIITPWSHPTDLDDLEKYFDSLVCPTLTV